MRRSRIRPRDATNDKNLALLIQLRWLAVLGQVATLAFVTLALGIALPLGLMAAVLVFLVGLNLASLLLLRGANAVTNSELFLEFLFDVAALTAQLYLSGGATNPFISLYLLQVILGVVLLESWSAWMLALVTGLCFVWLIGNHRPLVLPDPHQGDLLDRHMQGMAICFVLTAGLLAFFVTRIQRNLKARDAHLAALRQQRAEEEHIVRMGLLASGAAHELGTPLATLSVILGDWERMPPFRADPAMADELAEMQRELARCKSIVSGILLSSGDVRGEGAVRTTVGAFLDDVIAEWRDTRMPEACDYVNTVERGTPIISDAALKQVLLNVLDNALEASPGWVGVDASRQDDAIVVMVMDRGPGFTRAMLDGFGKPYRSTKGRPGSGLGLFLVVNVIRQIGGAVGVRNRESGGASVTLTLPLAALTPGGGDGG